MDFGLFSNGERTNKLAADTYDEDLYEVMLADRLGFKEAWISEHVGRSTGGRADTLSVADMFIIKAAALTKQIKMGPGVRPIAIYHPVQVAIDSAMVALMFLRVNVSEAAVKTAILSTSQERARSRPISLGTSAE